MFRQLLALLVFLWLALSPLLAQTPPPAQPAPAAPPQNAPGESAPASSGSALPWAVAIVFTIAILLIVCMPSRKSQT